jgi:cobalt-zinc-cadmium efflux system outer membrane protein
MFLFNDDKSHSRPTRKRRARSSVGLILILSAACLTDGQDMSKLPIDKSDPKSAALLSAIDTKSGKQTIRTITVGDAVSIFLQQNLQLVAAKYDIDSAEAEKLTARLRPNPQISFTAADIPLMLNRELVNPQTFDYSISQTFEMAGKRQKRMDVADANAQVAQAQFETTVWQLTNDVKKKFYAVLLAKSLFDLAKENRTTFDQIVEHTRDVFKLGEISGLDLQRLEVERIKFDTDLANTERDYEVALRDLRVALGGNYSATEVEVAGAIDYYQSYDFSFADLRDKAIAARPDLKVAKLTQKAADASIRLQHAMKYPDLTVAAGVEQVRNGGSTYNVGVSIPLPVYDRNQGERAKALIDKERAQNQEQQVTNHIVSDVDKALAAFNIQKRRVELYKSGILGKVTNIQTMTEVSLKAGESSTLELLDAIRTRRDTLAEFYQAIFDYQSALLDLELATATPILK